MIKKIKVVGLSLFLLLGQTAFAQISKKTKKELYPKQYTFEKAETFQSKGEYEKAIWFYINLFPDNQDKVIERVKEIKTKLDTLDIGMFIKTSFATYATFDPTITSFDNGVLNMDGDKLKRKGKWGDELIAIVSEK